MGEAEEQLAAAKDAGTGVGMAMARAEATLVKVEGADREAARVGIMGVVMMVETRAAAMRGQVTRAVAKVGGTAVRAARLAEVVA